MSTAKIEALHIRNVRHFTEVDINFNDRFNFIAGPNGSGKTSILACLSHCFSPEDFKYSRFNNDSEIWADLTFDESKYRIGLGDNSFSYSSYRTTNIRTWNAPPKSDDRVPIASHMVRERINWAPLFIGAQRNFKYTQIQGMKRESSQNERINEYSTNNTKALYGEWDQNIKQWMINRYFMIEKLWAAEEAANWNHLVQNLPLIAPFNSRFSYVKTERDLEPVFSIYGKECYLEELSSGFQAVLSIIAKIIEWVEGSNAPGERSVIESNGVVIIDELDLHLHPEWQFSLRAGLNSLFPKMQFIITTHSPHLLSSAQNNEVLILPKNYIDQKYIIRPSPLSYSGWTTDQILEEVMGVESLVNKEYEQLVADALMKIEAKDLSGLRNVISELSRICHANDTITIVLNARLAALEVGQND